MEIWNPFRNTKVWKKIKAKLESIKLRGGASLFLVIRTFVKHIFDPDLNIMACGIAYNFLMSLFPGIIFLFTLIPFLLPYFSLDFIDVKVINLENVEQELNLEQQIDAMLQQLLPVSVYDFMGPMINDIANNKRGGLMSVGFFFAFYLSTNAMVAIMDSFNHYYHTKEMRNWFHKRFIALWLTFLLALIMLLAVVVIVFGSVILNGMGAYINETVLSYLTSFLPYTVTGLLIFLIVSLIYKIAPAVKKRFDFLSIGSFIATLLIIGVSQGFAYYVNNFGSYNKLYGSIGALVGLMVLFYAMSYILLLGFHINASINEALHHSGEEKK